MKKIILASSIVLSGISMPVKAQSGTNSPYSQYGIGILADQSQGFNRGMNGLSLGLRYSDQVNVLNPASYSAVDSLTMIFDVGLSGQITNFNEGGKKINARNADFEYAVGAFRLLPKVGLSVGLIPFSNVGYSYYNISKIGQSTITSTKTYSGSGGFHQAFVGIGWSILENLSIGANLSYLWGTYDKSISISSSDTYVNTEVRTYSTQVSNYKLDLGLQWQKQITKNGLLTIGATYGLGHNLNSDVEAKTTSTNSQTGVSEESSSVIEDGLSVPHSFGLGASLRLADKLTFGVDYILQKWGSLDFPEIDGTKDGEYVMQSGLLKDRNKLTLGCEWIPNAQSSRFFDRIHYRLGTSYATPYIKVNGLEGPKEYSVSAGFGIPIINKYNNRSLLNISGQWIHSSAQNLITENTFRINIGITFNERWFMKWKVE